MQVERVQDKQGLERCWRALRRSTFTAYDCETSGLDPYTDVILLMQFCTDDETVWIVPAHADWTWTALPHLLTALNSRPEQVVIGHNIRFDYQMALLNLGVKLTNMWDTQLAESVLVAGRIAERVGLGPTLARRLRITVGKELQKSWIGQSRESFVPSEEQLDYATQDVMYLHRLRYAQLDKLLTEGTLPVAEMEFAAIPAFAEMELAGMPLDFQAHAQVIEAYSKQEAESQTASMAIIEPAYRSLVKRWNDALTPRYEARKAEVTSRLWRRKTEIPGVLLVLDKPAVRIGSPEAHALYQWRDKMKPKPTEITIGNDSRVRQALRTLGISRRLLPDLKATTVALALPQLRQAVTAGVAATAVPATTAVEARSAAVEATSAAAAAAATRAAVVAAGVTALTERASWKKAQKITSTYGYSMSAKVNPVTGRIHPHYNQLVSTGRTSSSDPNGQNMPKKIRACCVAGKGHKFVIADFAAMELRILAGMSGDPVMLDAFVAGKDLHKVTAASAWPDVYPSWEDVPDKGIHRDLGKRGNFGYIYGAGAKGLWLRGVMPDLETAERVRTAYLDAYAVAWEWITSEGEFALRNLYATTATGRKRYFTHPGTMPKGKGDSEAMQEWRKRRGRIRRQGMNHPIQGTGADIAKLAMTRLQQQFRTAGMQAQLSAMVHDELVVRCPSNEAEVVAEMMHEAMLWAGATLFTNVAIDADVVIKDRWEK